MLIVEPNIAVQLRRTYTSDIERAARNPTIEVVEQRAKALGVTPGELLRYDV